MTEVDIINLKYLAESQPSLCIPRVFNNITKYKIRQVFDCIALGNISRIDIKEYNNEKGVSFKRVYIHFDKWFWNENAKNVRRKLVSGKEIKIVYDNPWFWKVSASKWTPSIDLQEKYPPQHSRVHVDFENEHCNHVTDEFGCDLSVNQENNRRHDDSNECHRRPDNLRHDDDLRTEHHASNLKQPIGRQESRCDSINSNDLLLPNSHTFQHKADNSTNVEARTLSNSPPRSRPQYNSDTLIERFNEQFEYGCNLISPPLKKCYLMGGRKTMIQN